MGAFGTYAKKFQKIDVFQIFRDITRENDVQKWIIEVINRRVEFTGITSDGTKLQTDSSSGGNPYSIATMNIKDYLGQRISNVTLKDTGDFWDSFKIILLDDGFRIDADFEKKDGNIQRNFTQQYSSEKEFEDAIASLNQDEFRILVEQFYYPKFVKKVNAILQ